MKLKNPAFLARWHFTHSVANCLNVYRRLLPMETRHSVAEWLSNWANGELNKRKRRKESQNCYCYRARLSNENCILWRQQMKNGMKGTSKLFSYEKNDEKRLCRFSWDHLVHFFRWNYVISNRCVSCSLRTGKKSDKSQDNVAKDKQNEEKWSTLNWRKFIFRLSMNSLMCFWDVPL